MSAHAFVGPQGTRAARRALARRDKPAGGQPMEFVGVSHVDEMANYVTPMLRAWGGKPRSRPRRTDYPRSTGKPETPGPYSFLGVGYSAVTLWRCNGYQKFQHREHVWIEKPYRGVTPPGHGNRARRRLGQRAVWFAPPPHLQPQGYDGPGYVWVCADGAPAPKRMPWHDGTEPYRGSVDL